MQTCHLTSCWGVSLYTLHLFVWQYKTYLQDVLCFWNAIPFCKSSTEQNLNCSALIFWIWPGLLIRLNIAIFLWPVALSFFIFLLAGRRSKWLLCSAVAVWETALMMMTGSLKQAKHNALPRGLISRTNLALIRLRPLSVSSSVFSFFLFL